MMKKKVSLLMALVLCMSLCACGGDNAVSETTEAETNAPETTAAETKAETAAPETDAAETETAIPETDAPETEAPAETIVYKLGDVIETDLFRITPTFTGYAKELANWPDENYMTPEGQFSGVSAYNAAAEKVAMYGQVDIEYIGNEKSAVTLKFGLSVDYDDGYVFENADMGFCVSLDDPDWDDLDYTKMTFQPLSSSTSRILRYCIDVPEQVEANKDKALLVTFFVNGEPFVFDFRSAEVRDSSYDPRDVFYQPIDPETQAQIVSILKANTLQLMGWYDKTVGKYTFTFGDGTVEATLPIDSNYQYEFKGVYEVFSGSILISWDFGKQMHLDYTFDGTQLSIVDFDHDR